MDLDEARTLTSSVGRRLLVLARETRHLPAHRRPGALASAGPAEVVRLVLAQDDLRRRAGTRCPHAEALLFTRESLEQATAWPVAEERARRWTHPIGQALADLTAGVGLDALAAALAGRRVEAFERDAVRAHLLAANAEALGVAARVAVTCGDVRDLRPSGPSAYLDPARRGGGRRTRAAAGFAPPAADWPRLLAPFAAAMVKLPPVVEGALPLEGPVEWVSLDRRLRERRLLLGDLPATAPRRALALPSGHAVAGTGEAWPAPVAPREGDWLLDPDPAVTVGGLVGDLAAQQDLRPIHPRIAYLLGPARREGVPGSWLRIEAVLGPRRRDVDRWLAAVRGARPVVRTRGVDREAATFARRLRPAGPVPTAVVLTRGPDDRWLVLAGRVTDE